MRISIDKNDIGYDIKGFDTEISFNGKKLNYCITADEEKGTVLVFCEDAHGKPIIENGELKTEILHGKVEIL